MTHVGKRLRLRRLLGSDGRGVVVPMDHGVSEGPMPGLERPAETAARVVAGGADSVIVHKGLVRTLAPALGGVGFWLHVSAGTSLNPDPNDKRVVATVEEAVRLGADGVSLHVNVGAKEESRMVEDMGRLATECDRYGLPLLAMMYPRGHEVRNPHDLELVKKVARLGYELGADVLKVPYTGAPETFREVVRGVDVPVLVSGGPKAASDRDFLAMVAGALEAGGAGVSVGRNFWQHRDPTAMTRAVARLVHDRVGVEDALHEMGKAR
ncbi:MAG TPA: 2-amino-3,7-dideoxy-D-threo-hept-6-ulosonate synthase [Candidatus Thermoplasmatota archaeon]|nr:2-amino-3,7-dideoxy-D-threo-hept-6-ulosonate synthase [Candidatus Thermoplasmatota archaeon]